VIERAPDSSLISITTPSWTRGPSSSLILAARLLPLKYSRLIAVRVRPSLPPSKMKFAKPPAVSRCFSSSWVENSHLALCSQ
jgi:hypothetical protein